MNIYKLTANWKFVAILYPLLMAMFWATSNFKYSQIHLILDEHWWIIGIFAAIMLAIASVNKVRIHISSGFDKAALWIIVPVALVVLGGISTLTSDEVNWRVVGFTFIGTLFVGIAEEAAYRGLVFNSLSRNLSVTRAVVISSILFGLMHSVNLMNQELTATSVQVVITTFIGLAFGWIYIKTGGNLVLLIVLHWLYDAFLMIPLATTAGGNSLASLSLVLAAVGIGLTVKYARKYQNQNWSDVQLRGATTTL